MRLVFKLLFLMLTVSGIVYAQQHIGGQLNQAALENRTGDPSSGNVEGRIYFDTDDDVVKVYDGASYLEIGETTGFGSGDVLGPASATDEAIALYNGTTGKAIKNSSLTVSGDILSGLGTPSGATDAANKAYVDNKITGPASATDNGIPRFDGTTGKLIQDTSGPYIDDSGNLWARAHVFNEGDGLSYTGMFSPGTASQGVEIVENGVQVAQFGRTVNNVSMFRGVGFFDNSGSPDPQTFLFPSDLGASTERLGIWADSFNYMDVGGGAWGVAVKGNTDDAAGALLLQKSAASATRDMFAMWQQDQNRIWRFAPGTGPALENKWQMPDTVPSAGQVLSAAGVDNSIPGDPNWIQLQWVDAGGGSIVAAQAEAAQVAALSTTSFAWNDVSWTSESYDTDNAFDGTTFTAPEDGLYEVDVNFTVDLTGTPAGLLEVEVAVDVNGTNRTISYEEFGNGRRYWKLHGSTTLSLSATDTVKIETRKEGTDAWSINGFGSNLTIKKVGEL